MPDPEKPFAPFDERLHVKPLYYRIVRAPSGAWCVQLHDIKLEAMGLASENRAPKCFESVAQADSFARKRGLRPMRGE